MLHEVAYVCACFRFAQLGRLRNYISYFKAAYVHEYRNVTISLSKREVTMLMHESYCTSGGIFSEKPDH